MKTSSQRSNRENLLSKKTRYNIRGVNMDISDLESRLLELDKELHSILEEIRKIKSPREDVLKKAAGSWGYDVDSGDFVRKLRRSERLDEL